MTIHTIHIDMDGVIADFEGYIQQVTGKSCKELNSGHAVTPFSNDERTDPVYRLLKQHVNEHDMFYEISPVENFHEWKVLFYQLQRKGFRVELLSASPSEALHEKAKHQKIRWVRKHNLVVDNVIVVPTSSTKKKFARSSSILVDDYDKNVVSYIKSGGLGILHTMFAETKDRLEFYVGSLK